MPAILPRLGLAVRRVEVPTSLRPADPSRDEPCETD